MRISDWSSDVCSSDLAAGLVAPIQVLQGVDHLGACRYLLFRRHCILKIEENMIGGGSCGLCEHLLARRRYGQLHTTAADDTLMRSEEHTSELQSLMRISYAVFCLKKKTIQNKIIDKNNTRLK